ncbi:uncharacterized protein LOC126852207 [Cataglyphis hispanica]|uniref:uncharacterized protein LOC126852207 n=1 Tax=Cataglyphis hispanica TaxID=1086592 RepID=UPI00217F2789|nr:uncharacterized protein LOC126852207 [Cataglyphis hispanica]
MKMSDSQNIIDEGTHTLHETKLCIKLTNKGMFINGSWNNEKLLALLKDKLVQRDKIKSFDKSLQFIIHSGIYSEYVLLELERKGMSPHRIMKAIKYGLLNLTSEEQKYFQDFETEVQDTWTKEKLDEKLISNLIATGLTEDQCWNIIMCGLVSQDENILYRLLLNGIDVPGILSWPGESKPVTPTMIRFLKKLGIDEDVLSYVKENGIDDEIEDMLIDLGYNEYKEKEDSEEVLCECNLTILESHSTLLEAQTASDIAPCPLLKSFSSCILNKVAPLSNVSTCTQHHFAACICYLNLLPKEKDDENLKRNDYLRQNVMVPLSWAISRALRYAPSDPIHYIAHQLLRWKYGNVPEEEVHNAHQFITSVIIIMDQRLMVKKKMTLIMKCINIILFI